MPNIIVISGKGGTGKTTISALITLMLASKKSGPVLSVDADPNNNLSDALGLANTATIADIIDEVAKNPEIVPKNMGKDAFIEYKIHRDLTESSGFDLLVMGRPEGPGCYCYINNVLRNAMDKLVKDYSFVVIDNEAGMEHFSRKTMRKCDDLLVVSDESKAGLRCARRIFDLTQELGISSKRKFLVINGLKNDQDIGSVRSELLVDEVFTVPFDKEISSAGSAGVSLSGLSSGSKALSAIKAMGERIWPMN